MSKDLFSLAGKLAIVTGAARGLGKATAIGLAEFGADVAAVDLSIDNCQDTIATIHSSGRKCSAYACEPRWIGHSAHRVVVGTGLADRPRRDRLRGAANETLSE